MPTDANGVHSLPDGYFAETGETILASQHNPPLEDLSASMTLRFMRSGVTPMTGPVKAADGTVSAPGYTFSTAPSTGVYKTADGIGVSVGGVMVAEFTSGGLRTGSRYLGELIPYSGLTVQPLTVFPVGQTLSRTTYAALWAFAQTEIAAGNTFYNNGDGSTTFGIGDLRGRVIATKDNLGGSTAGRITATYFGAATGKTGLLVGDVGGLESSTLVTANLPAYTPSGNVSVGGTIVAAAPVRDYVTSGSSDLTKLSLASNIGTDRGTISLAVSGAAATFFGSAQGGSSTPLKTVPPMIVVTHLLFAGA